MKKTFAIIIYVLLYPLLTLGQITKTEEYISLNNKDYSLSEVTYKDNLNRIIEKRKIKFDGNSSEDWITLSKLYYKDTLLVKIEIISKDAPNILTTGLNLYDKNHKKTNSIFKRDNDTILNIDYVYDDKMQLVEESTTTYINYFGEKATPITTTKQYKYKDRLLLEEWILSDKNTKTEHYRYEYTTESNIRKNEKLLIDEIEYLEKQRFIEIYNTSNQKIEDYTYFNNGTLFRKHIFNYDVNGQLIEVLEFGLDTEKPIVTIKYKHKQIDKID